jgi:hypothetical protein
VRTVHVPAHPGRHVPDAETHAAMRALADAALQCVDEGTVPIRSQNGGDLTEWNIDGDLILTCKRVGPVSELRRQTIHLSSRKDGCVGRLIIDECRLPMGEYVDAERCLSDIRLAIVAVRDLTATSHAAPGEIADEVQTASLEAIRQIVDVIGATHGIAHDDAYDHQPATPWQEARGWHIRRTSGKHTGMCIDPFPTVLTVAVDPVYGSDRRNSVRLRPHMIEHHDVTPPTAMTRLRGAAVLTRLLSEDGA